MTRLHTFLFLIAPAGLLTGCATPPLVLDRTHPASTDAPEAATAPARPTLRADANTRRTRELFAQREQQAKAAESESPADQTRINPNTAKPQKSEGHENH